MPFAKLKSVKFFSCCIADYRYTALELCCVKVIYNPFILFYKIGDAVETPAQAQSGPAVDESVVEQLQTMGFSRNACVRACMATNSNVEEASNWLMEHIEDTNLNDPIPSSGAVSNDFSSVDPVALSMLLEMGIAEDLAKRALEVCCNRVEEAINMAFTNPEELLNPVQTLEKQDDSSSAKAMDTETSKEGISDGDPSRYELIAFISHMGQSTSVSSSLLYFKAFCLLSSYLHG